MRPNVTLFYKTWATLCDIFSLSFEEVAAGVSFPPASLLLSQQLICIQPPQYCLAARGTGIAQRLGTHRRAAAASPLYARKLSCKQVAGLIHLNFISLDFLHLPSGAGDNEWWKWPGTQEADERERENPRGWKNPESDSSDISPRLLHLLQQQQQQQQQRCLWPWGRASKQGDVPTVASGNAVCEHFICWHYKHASLKLTPWSSQKKAQEPHMYLGRLNMEVLW